VPRSGTPKKQLKTMLMFRSIFRLVQLRVYYSLIIHKFWIYIIESSLFLGLCGQKENLGYMRVYAYLNSANYLYPRISRAIRIVLNRIQVFHWGVVLYNVVTNHPSIIPASVLAQCFVTPWIERGVLCPLSAAS